MRLHILKYICLVMLICAFAGFLNPVPGLAQGMDFSASPSFSFSGPSKKGSKELRVRLSTQYIAPAKLTNGLGSSSIFRTTLAAQYGRYAISYRHSHFSWQSKDDLPPSIQGKVPWENLHDITLQGRVFQGKFWDRWHYWLHGEISSAFEADFPGALGVGVSGELAFDIYEGWMLGVIGRSVALNPLNDDLFGEGTLGLAVHVSQKQLHQALKGLGLVGDDKNVDNDSIHFGMAFTTSSHTYRLADSNPLYSNGYMALVSSKVGVYMDWQATDNLNLSIGPEYIFSRKYRLYNSKGTLESSHTQHPSIGGTLGVHWKF